jgi:hypothetical protein
MFLKTMSSLSVVALGFAPGTLNANFQVLLPFIVCAAAMLIMLHALRTERQYSRAAAFAGLVVLFNPIWPIALRYRAFLPLDLMGIWLFVSCVTLHKAKLQYAVTAIMDRSRQLRPL